MSKANPQPAVVLVADRTLSASYKVLFEGIFGTMQTTQVPQLAMKHFVSPPVKTDSSGRAVTAPLGIRRVEASLRSAGLPADQVVCTTPEAVHKMIGPWTKIVVVSSSDFLGIGMSNTTTSSFWKGRLYTEYWLSQMMSRLCTQREKYGFKIVAGGAGAWQLLTEPEKAAELGFDLVFEGYFENAGPALFMDILEGRNFPSHFREEGTCCQNVKPILQPALLGMIELSRGCGKGCKFCLMGQKKMEHLPPETILADLQTNVAGEQRNIVSSSEDFFRYGAIGPKINFSALANLLSEMQKVPGRAFMQPDHGNISSVAQLSVNELLEIRRLLDWPAKSKKIWINLGVESANGLLVQSNGPAKIAPFRPEDWPDLVRESVDKLIHCGFVPVLSLILGLPGETPEDVKATLELVKWVEQREAVIFPVFHEPFAQQFRVAGQAFTLDKMRLDHLELYIACYEINFRRVPGIFWDNQRAGGVSWAKRAMIQILGKSEVRAWRKNFKSVKRRILSK